MSGDTLDTLVGKTIADRYEITRVLGAGGMGAVYEARQLSMDRLIALKLLHAHYASHKQAVARFNREMRATSKIEHPNTIRVYDFGQTDDGRLFLAMEYLKGGTLSDALSAGDPMPTDRLVHIALQITKALHAAHSDGIVHRDLKPDNVMLLDRYGETDFVKVLDFGIARVLDDQARTQLTQEGAVVGTPAYMSPEQATGALLDHRTDLYSLGVILFEMATGQVPFDAPTTISLMVMHVQEPAPRPSELVPGMVVEGLEKLILSLLAKNPADRPKTAAEVIATLEEIGKPSRHMMAADTRVGLAETGVAGAVGPPGGTAGTGSSGPVVIAPKNNTWLLWGVLGLVVVTVGVVLAVVLGGGGGPGPAGDADATTVVVAADANVGAPDSVTTATAQDAAAAPNQADVETPEIAPAPAADAAVAAVPPASDAQAAPDAAAAAAVDAAATVEEDAAVAVPDVPTEPDLVLIKAREALGGHYAAAGDPPPPADCEVQDTTLLGAIAAAAERLGDGAIGGNRARDREALMLLDGVADAGASEAEYWVQVARGRLFAGKPTDDALAAATKAGKLCERWALPPNTVGNAQLVAKNNDAAVRAYLAATARDPEYAAPRFNLGLIRLGQGDAKSAVEALDLLLASHPGYPTANLVRGQAHLKLGQTNQAIDDLDAAVKLDPKKAVAWLLLGQARQRGEDAGGAEAAYCEARALGHPAAETLCPDDRTPLPDDDDAPEDEEAPPSPDEAPIDEAPPSP